MLYNQLFSSRLFYALYQETTPPPTPFFSPPLPIPNNTRRSVWQVATVVNKPLTTPLFSFHFSPPPSSPLPFQFFNFSPILNQVFTLPTYILFIYFTSYFDANTILIILIGLTHSNILTTYLQTSYYFTHFFFFIIKVIARYLGFINKIKLMNLWYVLK